MNSSPIYLDYNATTPCAPEVIDAMLPFFGSNFGNPASTHVIGRSAARTVENARTAVGYALGVSAEDLVFTSGATESNCMVLNALAQGRQKRDRVVVGSGEHKSVLEPCRWLQENGFKVELIPLDRSGIVNVAEAERLIDDTTLLVSVQGANNETGVLQPVEAIAAMARSRGALMHCDASQMLGKVRVALDEMGVDYASVSAHKAYGPKGVGACYIRPGGPRAALRPLLRGGGQECDLRAGTLNVPGIVGFGSACQLLGAALDHDTDRVSSVRDHFEMKIHDLCPETIVIGSTASRLSGTSCLMFDGVPADILLARATGLCISSGSACTSGTVSPSHVVLACGFSRDEARRAVRISFGRYSTRAEAELAAVRLAGCVTAIRADLSFQAANMAQTNRERADET